MSSEKTGGCRVYVYTACTLVAVVLNYLFGKEMASDVLHYHFYAGFSALNDRFEQDYFAAGPQSYFNPYAYVPFYALVKMGLPSLAVSTVLALVQSVVLWLTYELASMVSPSQDRGQRLFFAVCATVLAFMNPTLLQQIGSSFSDITTTALVLGGWLLLTRAIQRPSTRRVVLGALLLGIAAALKPTNSVHALAGFLLVAFVPLPFLPRIRSLSCFGVALGASFVLTAAPWSYRLAGRFGNPMFPLLNNVFKSPEYTTAPIKAYRFIPGSLTEALLRPFAISGTGGMIHEEISSPDIRYALLLLISLIFLIMRARKSTRSATIPAEASRSEPATRSLFALGCAFTADWIVWLTGSGNSRYFIPMACVAAVLSLSLLFRLLANNVGGRNGVLAALFLAQGAQLALGTDYRWNYAPWGGPWFNVELPERLSKEPSLYLSVGAPSNSFLVPFLAKGSGFVNVSGGYMLGPGGANAQRVMAMIRRRAPYVRVIASGEAIYPDAAQREPRQSDIDDLLHTYGLRLDMSDCETITVRGLRSPSWRPFGSSIPAAIEPPGERYTGHFASCRLVTAAPDPQEIAERRTVDRVLDRLEDACPALFQPARLQTEHINQVWLRFYGATDLIAFVANGEVKFVDTTRGPRETDVGSENEWTRGTVRLECGRRDEIYFARVTQATP